MQLSGCCRHLQLDQTLGGSELGLKRVVWCLSAYMFWQAVLDWCDGASSDVRVRMGWRGVHGACVWVTKRSLPAQADPHL